MLFAAAGLSIALSLILLVAHRHKAYLAELIVSFMPHILVLNFCCLLVLKVELFVRVTQQQQGVLILVTLLLLAAALPLLRFSFLKPSISPASSSNFRAVFFNKLITNESLQQIADRLNQLQPTVVGLVEVRRRDYQFLKNSVRLPHTYISNKGFGMSGTEHVLLSKYPISNAIVKEIDAYSAVTIVELEIDGKKVTLAVTQTVAPIIPPMLIERNRGIAKLSDLMRGIDRLVLIGDFNMTPWSAMYKTMRQSLPDLYNTAQGRGLKFTWKFLRPFVSHIDHIFVSRHIKTKQLKTDSYLGSDHKLIYADLQI